MQSEQVPGDGVLDQEEELTYHEIDELQSMGVGAAEIQKLKDAGFETAKGVLATHSKNLCSIKGLSEAKIEKIRSAANKLCNISFHAAKSELQRRQQQEYTNLFKITTGSSELDKILGGGISSQQMTEFHGEWRTGKTQIWFDHRIHTMCISTQLPDEGTGYPGGRVVYIDTEGTFRPERLSPICERFGVDYEQALENIYFIRALNCEHQYQAVKDMAVLLRENRGVVKLVIVDSIMALFRVDFQGRGELQRRQADLGQFLHLLHSQAEEFNFAVVMTNQMTSDPSGGMSFVADPKKPIGGHVLAHAVQTRLSLKKGSGDDRIAKLVDAADLMCADATFTLTAGGVTDAK